MNEAVTLDLCFPPDCDQIGRVVLLHIVSEISVNPNGTVLFLSM